MPSSGIEKSSASLDGSETRPRGMANRPGNADPAGRETAGESGEVGMKLGDLGLRPGLRKSGKTYLYSVLQHRNPHAAHSDIHHIIYGRQKTLHALEYLAQPEKHPPQPVCAVYGDEAFLRRQAILKLREAVLGGDEGDFSFTTVDGRKAEWRDVHEDLSTVAMFGGGRRLVLVEEADDFVSRYRGELEDYVAKPSRTGVLVLDLTTFPVELRGSTSRWRPKGLAIDCSTPAAAKLCKWLVDWAKKFHRTTLSPAAAETLVEIIGPELGLLDQEIAKLAQAAGSEQITPEMVTKYVGGWRAKTTWEMLDAALDGKVREAMQQLDRLLEFRRAADRHFGPDFRLAAPFCRRHAADSSGRSRRPADRVAPSPRTRRHQAVRVAKGRTATPPPGPRARLENLRVAPRSRSGPERRQRHAAAIDSGTADRPFGRSRVGRSHEFDFSVRTRDRF